MPLLDPIPSPVEHADLIALEWEPLLVLVAGFAASPVGREAILALHPSSDEVWIGRQHRLAAEVGLILEQQVSIPLGGLFDPTQLAAKAQIAGAALEAVELQSVARLANDVAAWQALLREPPVRLVGKLRGLSELSAALTTSLRPLAEAIERTIQPDGSLADDASPELNRIRREQERQQKLIEESLRAALRKLSAENATQDDVITIRGERFVIPVRAELKRRVTGVIHGTSSSGQTVYVEPLETIEQNNELVRLIEEEQAEIHRIFVALTRQVGGYALSLVEGARVLALVDSLLARARFAREFDCISPGFGPEMLRVEGARHPLLEKRLRTSGGQAVPLVLELTSNERQLIISGPNTGGKTVALKTTALLAMMAQAGIPVPAARASGRAFVRAGHIEVAQRGVTQAVDAIEPGQHLLHQELGLAVGIGRREARIFLNRNGFRLAVDGSGGGKDQPFWPCSQHGLEQRERGSGVVAEENLRPHHRLASLNERGKVEDGVERLALFAGVFKDGFKSRPVGQLTLDEFDPRRQ